VVFGKFLGCWLACGLALLGFYLFFLVVTGWREPELHLAEYGKALWLHWMMLAVVVALTLLGSVVFSAVSANATICIIAIFGILFLGEHLGKLSGQQPEPVRSLGYTMFYCLPHIELFDVRRQLVNDRSLPGWGDCGLASLYALAYAGALLQGSWLIFRRKNLST
jgi:hypothetical protein